MLPSSGAYCMYLRKSRADFEAEQRGEGETLSRHKSILANLAARNHHAISRIYEEIVSGETISDRPEMQRLLSDILAGKWAGVYVMEVERLARGDTMDQGLVAHAFKAAGAYIISPAKVYNPHDPTDEEYFEFSLFMARREYKTIHRRMQGGRLQSVMEGKFMGSRPPYGYRRVKLEHDKGYTLAIHEEEANIVRQIFSWYLHGIDGTSAGIAHISTVLQRMHVPTGEHGTTWKPCRVQRILINPTYTGMIQWGKDKTVRTVTPSGVTKHRVLRDHGDLYQGLHPAIIDNETFQAVQDKLHGYQGHLPVRKDTPLSNPLAGLVICSICGHSLSGLPASGHNAARLKCLTHACPTVGCNQKIVESAILGTLHAWLDDPGSAQMPPEVTEGPSVLSISLDSLQADRVKLLAQITRVQELLEQNVYTVEQYSARYATLQERLRALDENIASVKAQLADHPVYCTPAELAPAIIHLFEEYDSSTPEQKNNLLRSCISKVVYTKTKKDDGQGIPRPSSQLTLDIYPKIK